MLADWGKQKKQLVGNKDLTTLWSWEEELFRGEGGIVRPRYDWTCGSNQDNQERRERVREGRGGNNEQSRVRHQQNTMDTKQRNDQLGQSPYLQEPLLGVPNTRKSWTEGIRHKKSPI